MTENRFTVIQEPSLENYQKVVHEYVLDAVYFWTDYKMNISTFLVHYGWGDTKHNLYSWPWKPYKGNQSFEDSNNPLSFIRDQIFYVEPNIWTNSSPPAWEFETVLVRGQFITEHPDKITSFSEGLGFTSQAYFEAIKNEISTTQERLKQYREDGEAENSYAITGAIEDIEKLEKLLNQTKGNQFPFEFPMSQAAFDLDPIAINALILTNTNFADHILYSAYQVGMKYNLPMPINLQKWAYQRLSSSGLPPKCPLTHKQTNVANATFQNTLASALALLCDYKLEPNSSRGLLQTQGLPALPLTSKNNLSACKVIAGMVDQLAQKHPELKLKTVTEANLATFLKGNSYPITTPSIDHLYEAHQDHIQETEKKFLFWIEQSPEDDHPELSKLI